MRYVINISEYDKEWIKNAYEIPQEINTKIADAIISAEPLELKPHWTKCSKSLPKVNDLYVVTCDNGHSRWSDAAEYSERHGGWRYGLHSDDVIAWMPLPEPWRGDAE